MAKEEKISFVKKIVSKKWFIIFILVVIVGLIVYVKGRSGKQQESTRIEKGTVREELILSGEIKADNYAKLSFPASGKIAWVGVSEGDEVKRGQALAKLDTTTLNSAFQQARSALRAAEATVANIHDQVKDHSSDETFVQKDTRTTAEAVKDEAYEAYVAAEYNLRNSTLTAPFDGIVTFLAHPYSGINVLVTETQVEILNNKTMYFEVTADQSEVTNLINGQRVDIALDSFPDEVIKGEVNFISYTPKTDEVGIAYKIRVKFLDLKDEPQKFRLGMGGDAKFIISEKKNVLYLPPKFINSDTGGKFVYKGKKNNKVYVEIGIEGEDRVEIKGDVEEKDIVFD